jgi:hypothetical protein
MDRREWMKVMALSLGSSLALPESVFGQMAEPLDAAKLKFFNETQRKLVAVLAETIIPETDTPGAIQAGVPGWIELLVQDCFEKADQKVILDGLAMLEERSSEAFKKPFGDLTTAEKIQLLTTLEQEAIKSGKRQETFIGKFKELTKFTYASSEIGATKAFEYTLVPGRWEPAMDLKPGQKVYAM